MVRFLIMENKECIYCGSKVNEYKPTPYATIYYCTKFCKSAAYTTIYCTHTDFILVRDKTRVRKQCKDCGQLFGHSVKKTSVNYNNLPDSSELFEKHNTLEYYNKMKKFHKRYQEKYQEVRESYEDAFFTAYTKYLKSKEWEAKRKLVLKRDNYLCQCCLVNTATQVHHLTYEKVGKEPAFQLTSVCTDCHKFIELSNPQDIYDGHQDFISWVNAKY